MKITSSIALLLTAAAIGMALPARADNAVVSENIQTAIVTGSNNTVTQNNNTYVRNSGRGTSGTYVRNRQTADVAGNNNTVTQTNDTQVENRHQPRR